MLLVITNSQSWYDGKEICRENGKVTFTSERWHRYTTDPSSDAAAQIISLDLSNRIVFIRTPALGHRPVAYHASPGLVIISHSPGEVARELKRRDAFPEINAVGFWESLLFSTPFLGRTLFKSIQQVCLGESLSLNVSTGTVLSHGKWQPQLYGNEDKVDTLEKAKQLLLELVKGSHGNKECIIPLSGGLDSRFLVAATARLGIQNSTFTFGSFGSAEVPLAKSVAHFLHVPWQQFDLSPEDYLSYGQEISILTGGMLSAMHMHLFSCLSRLPSTEHPVLHGFMGDPIAGDHAKSHVIPMTIEAAVSDVANRRGLRNGPFSDLIPQAIRSEIIADLFRIAQECAERNGPECLEEYLFLVERQRMISYLPAVIETLRNTVCPFANSQFADFFLSLPRPLRAHRCLFRTAATELFPEIFSLPSTASIGAGTTAGLFRRIENKMRSSVQHATDIATAGRYVVFNPYSYEQHYFLLNRLHRQKMFAAARMLQEQTGLPMIDLVYRALDRRFRRPDFVFGVFSTQTLLSDLGGFQ